MPGCSRWVRSAPRDFFMAHSGTFRNILEHFRPISRSNPRSDGTFASALSPLLPLPSARGRGLGWERVEWTGLVPQVCFPKSLRNAPVDSTRVPLTPALSRGGGGEREGGFRRSDARRHSARAQREPPLPLPPRCAFGVTNAQRAGWNLPIYAGMRARKFGFCGWEALRVWRSKRAARDLRGISTRAMAQRNDRPRSLCSRPALPSMITPPQSAAGTGMIAALTSVVIAPSSITLIR